MSRSLLVAECFGPTLRSEGPSTGQVALVIRLSRCNLSCPGCDTPFTWDWSRFDPGAESRRYDVDELVQWAVGSPARLVVITGGEPLLQQEDLVALVARLAEVGQRVEIETNGTVVPSPELVAAADLFVVSPKLTTFAAVASPVNRINAAALDSFVAAGRAVFMFVVQNRADIEEVADLEQRFGLYPVWVMPEGTERGRVLAGMSWLADATADRGWNLSGRLQVLLSRYG